MLDENDQHVVCVATWLERSAKDLPPARLLALFELAFGTLWRRAHPSLGAVTLAAIVDRVFLIASEQFPMLLLLQVETAGIRFDELRKRVDDLQRDDVVKAFQFVLVEFLRVLGRLTAEILTPALHSELSKVTLVPVAPSDEAAQNQTKPRHSKKPKDVTP